jgi:diacylglycerol O-acyltransferase
LAGTAVHGMALWVPSTGPLGLGVSLFSYHGNVVVALIADTAVADAAAVASAIDAELDADNRAT